MFQARQTRSWPAGSNRTQIGSCRFGHLLMLNSPTAEFGAIFGDGESPRRQGWHRLPGIRPGGWRTTSVKSSRSCAIQALEGRRHPAALSTARAKRHKPTSASHCQARLGQLACVRGWKEGGEPMLVDSCGGVWSRSLRRTWRKGAGMLWHEHLPLKVNTPQRSYA
jgi:hypothetical protein